MANVRAKYWKEFDEKKDDKGVEGLSSGKRYLVKGGPYWEKKGHAIVMQWVEHG